MTTLIVLMCMVPLLLVLIIVIYRKIQSKILETQSQEQEAHFAELRRERARIQQEQQREKEVEVEKYLDEEMEKIDSSNVKVQSIVMEKGKGEIIDVIVVNPGVHDDEGELTDDEFFELPLPPTPSRPSSYSPIVTSAKSEKSSIVNNDEISLASSPSSFNPISYDTPKIDNHQIMFKFPPSPRRPPPPPPTTVNLITNQFNDDNKKKNLKEAKEKRNLDLTLLPPVPPRRKFSESSSSTSSNPTSPTANFNSTSNTTNRKSHQPVIIETIPKTLLESDV
jgi:hypothetical protein